jgi:hypothetical protein
MMKVEPLESNPWDLKSLDDFLYYNCPECVFKSIDSDTFLNHADLHPLASQFVNSSHDTKGFSVKWKELCPDTSCEVPAGWTKSDSEDFNPDISVKCEENDFDTGSEEGIKIDSEDSEDFNDTDISVKCEQKLEILPTLFVSCDDNATAGPSEILNPAVKQKRIKSYSKQIPKEQVKVIKPVTTKIWREFKTFSACEKPPYKEMDFIAFINMKKTMKKSFETTMNIIHYLASCYSQETRRNFFKDFKHVTEACATNNQKPLKKKGSSAYLRMRERNWIEFQDFTQKKHNWTYTDLCAFFYMLKNDKKYSQSTLRYYMTNVKFKLEELFPVKFSEKYPQLNHYVHSLN